MYYNSVILKFLLIPEHFFYCLRGNDSSAKGSVVKFKKA
ncbi:hypothetical protein protein [Bacillus cereus G9241]|nr:hypothetical protein protein [Bacillus cereus G9241]